MKPMGRGPRVNDVVRTLLSQRRKTSVCFLSPKQFAWLRREWSALNGPADETVPLDGKLSSYETWQATPDGNGGAVLSVRTLHFAENGPRTRNPDVVTWAPEKARPLTNPVVEVRALSNG